MSNYQQITELLDGFVKDGLPGCCLAFAKDGETLYEHYSGYENLETGKPMNENTLFRLMSMTKVIVMTAGLMLYERGKFLLNDPLYEYFPEYKNTQVVEYLPSGFYTLRPAKSPILVKDAFSMSCGMPYQYGDNVTAKAMFNVMKELKEKYGNYDIETEVAAMGSVPIAFDPGTHWLYGYGHDIVSGLIQRVSGMRTGEFIKKEILDPLGMTHTGYHFHDHNEENMTPVYHPMADGKMDPQKGLLDHYHAEDSKMDMGGAGIYSTLTDYLKFSQMLANGGNYNGQQIIGRKTIDLMRENQLNEDQLKDFRTPYLDGYGYGLGVRTLLSKAKGNFNASLGEFGWTGAYGTYVSIDPSEHFSLVYMHQRDPNNELYYHHRVRNTVYGTIK